MCSGLQGLDKLKEKVFDLVFCDFLMPVMDGLDCVKNFRQWEVMQASRPRQFILGISAHAGEVDIEKGLNAGMDDFMSKPVQLKALKALIQREEFLNMQLDLDKICGTECKRDLNNESCGCVKPSVSVTFSEGDQGQFMMLQSRNCIEFVEQHSSDIISEDGSSDQKGGQDSKEEAGGPVRSCLVADDSYYVAELVKNLQDIGWRSVVVSTGEEALRSLQSRNWDAVIVGDKLSEQHENMSMTGMECIAAFRHWETTHRVAKQQNVILMSRQYAPPPPGALVTTTRSMYPRNFDGAVSKPIPPRDFDRLFRNSVQGSERKSSDIVVR